MTYATIFSGIGGWEIGLAAAGWQLRWQCECDRFCCAVLGKRFGVPVASDVHSRKLFKFLAGRFGSIGAARVDCIVGSPPCQPFSVAGQKHGVADRRHLYPAFIAAVRILRPRWVLMENVSGLLSDRRAFGQYIGGLAEIGFDCVWHSIPACAVGANHQRDRLWIIANNDSRRAHAKQVGIGWSRAAPDIDRNGSKGNVPDPAQGGSRCGSAQRQPGQSGQLCEAVADTASARCKERQNIGTGRSDAKTDGCGSEQLERSSPNVSDTAGDLRRASGHVGPKTSDGRGDASDSECGGRQGWKSEWKRANSTLSHSWWSVEPDVGRVASRFSVGLDGYCTLNNAHQSCITKASAAGLPTPAAMLEVWEQVQRATTSQRSSICFICGVPLSKAPYHRRQKTWEVGTWTEEREGLQCLRRGVHELFAFESENLLQSVSVSNWKTQCTQTVVSRIDRLKALGNAVVPQIPFLIASAINQTEKA